MRGSSRTIEGCYSPPCYNLQPGTPVQYEEKGEKANIKLRRNCTVIQESRNRIDLQSENYRITVDKFEIGKKVRLYLIGEVKA